MLPDRNSPYGRIVSEYIDSLPGETDVHLTECCWGEWGQPEPKAVYYQLRRPEGRGHLISTGAIDCTEIDRSRDTVLIGPPDLQYWSGVYADCMDRGEVKMYSDSRGQPVFSRFYLGKMSE